MSKKNRTFKAEIQQLLDLVIHSLYSKKEIFLRELISNASDAIDRAQYLGLTDKSVISDAPQWKINVIADKEERTLMVADNGMGMSEADLEQNLGVIASSGTKAFAEAMKEQNEVNLPELIGQFGVGFYSAFMVAEEVTVITLKRGDGEEAVKWSSKGAGSYTLESAARERPGTTIVLKLREGMDEYLDEWRVRELVRRYSDFIAYPVRFGEKGEAAAEDVEPLNTMKALWKRSKSEVKPEEYKEFYNHLTHDYDEPLRTIPIAVEGVIEFRALLFLPQKAGFELMMPNRKSGLHLYVRNVFIGSDFELLLPEYLRFVKGVVDSSDLPLNVSREMLQDDAVIRKIRSNLTGKVLGTLAEMQEKSTEEYEKFFVGFGQVVKEGLHSDFENSDKLKDLMLYRSAASDDNRYVTFKEYVVAMPEGQKDIYYLISDDLESARRSPHIEGLKKRGYDVLFFTDPIDQWLVDSLREYDGKKLVAVDQGKLDLGESEESEEERVKEAEGALQGLMKYIGERLADEVSEVRLSTRLTDSACCLVADDNAMSASMERMMRAMNQEVPKQKRILELNPDHVLIERLRKLADEAPGGGQLEDAVDLLYGQALLSEGSLPKNPQLFNRLVANLMVAQS